MCRSDDHGSEENEGLSNVAINVLSFLSKYVESNSLGEGSALTNGNNIADSETEGGRAMGRDGLMSLLEPVVLLDVMKVVTANNNSVGHLVREDNTPSRYNY